VLLAKLKQATLLLLKQVTMLALLIFKPLLVLPPITPLKLAQMQFNGLKLAVLVRLVLLVLQE
jgi:hypothetical protein